MLKTGVVAALLVIVLTPKLDDFTVPDIELPLVSTAIAAPLNSSD